METLINPIKKTIGSVSSFIAITLFYSLIIFITPVISMAQIPNWSWISSAGGISNDYGHSICIDINGNIYTTGYFSESITFESITLTDAGSNDIFLVKYNDQGNVIWANSFGGTGLDYTNKIVLDASENIIITGAFRSESITFGTFTLANPNFEYGYNAFFVAKINSDGNVIWASTALGDGNCSGSDVDTDNNGNIVVTGSFSGISTTFGTITLSNSSQTFPDLFIVKYNALGDVLWAQSFGGNSYDYGSGVAIDNDGNINLIGYFQSNSITFGTTSFMNTGGSDYFIVQFNSSGGINWLRNALGDGDDVGADIVTGDYGNIFVTGTYAGSSITFDINTLPGNGYDNIFILKYDNGGNLGWIHSALGDDNDEAYALTVDNEGSVLVTGEFASNQITFGDYSLTNSSSDYSDLFVTKINSEGRVAWAISAGGDDDDWGSDISISSNGNAYITGSFYSSVINFGSTSLVNTNNNTDYFIAKLNSTTGISDETFKRNCIVYPNPAKDLLHIKTTTNTNIEISNMTGQTVLVTEVSPNKATVNISTLIPGLYFIKIFTEEITITNKLIKE